MLAPALALGGSTTTHPACRLLQLPIFGNGSSRRVRRIPPLRLAHPLAPGKAPPLLRGEDRGAFFFEAMTWKPPARVGEKFTPPGPVFGRLTATVGPGGPTPFHGASSPGQPAEARCLARASAPGVNEALYSDERGYFLVVNGMPTRETLLATGIERRAYDWAVLALTREQAREWDRWHGKGVWRR